MIILADNGEKYNVAITKVDTNEFENVVIGDKMEIIKMLQQNYFRQ